MSNIFSTAETNNSNIEKKDIGKARIVILLPSYNPDEKLVACVDDIMEGDYKKFKPSALLI
mgnify:CR=1 FL=1